MKKFLILVAFSCMVAGITNGISQTKAPIIKDPKVWVYYFHPSDRCPIDQSIESNSKSLVQSAFGKEIGDGTLIFRVLNTDDKANEKIASGFDINAQALYIVRVEKGKEIKKNITRFAFDYGKSNPGKFKAGLKAEIEAALK